MYSSEDFLLLEGMTTKELEKEVKEAYHQYDMTQDYYKFEEEHSTGGFGCFQVSVEVMIMELKNIEGYIAKAQSLLDEKLGNVLMPTVVKRVKTMKQSKKVMDRFKKLRKQREDDTYFA